MEAHPDDRTLPPRNIMHRFQITEVSGVDRPAQEHAQATIIKRDDRTFRKFPPDLRSRAAEPPSRDQLTAAMLKLQLAPLTTPELEFAGQLASDPRRTFLLADHETRKGLMAVAGAEHREEDDQMMKFEDFNTAVAHYAKSGMTNMRAMQVARDAHPDLFAKLRNRPAEIAKAAAGERARIQKGLDRQRRVNALVHSTMVANRCGAVLAIQKVRDAHPELFAEA